MNFFFLKKNDGKVVASWRDPEPMRHVRGSERGLACSVRPLPTPVSTSERYRVVVYPPSLHMKMISTGTQRSALNVINPRRGDLTLSLPDPVGSYAELPLKLRRHLHPFA